ncbi:hypothetical protein [Agromyces allii]|uniref:hypothetical protein n=1 Tax=Agromyces allii TaxID=393607 RepID=UPI0012F8EFD1|nr:hypothetical protein [Agromyces allii]
MSEDDRAYWSAVVQIIPVLLLALALEYKTWLNLVLDLVASSRRFPVFVLAGFVGFFVLIVNAAAAEVVGLAYLADLPSPWLDLETPKFLAIAVIVGLMFLVVLAPAMFALRAAIAAARENPS